MAVVECVWVVEGGRRFVPLPTYVLVEDLGATARVLVPDDIVTGTMLDEAKLRALYKGQLGWDLAGVLDGVQVR